MEGGKTEGANTTRVLIRLKHSLPEGAEIHCLLPDTDEEFQAAVARGEIKELGPRLTKILADLD